MGDPNSSSPVIRFGVFEFDPEAGELRKQGLKVKLHGQPLQVLDLLLERPGRVVTREELREGLWPSHTYVDFEHGLNAAIQRLREVLGDSANNPRFVETLPRRGYRFIYPLENGSTQGRPGRPRRTFRRRWMPAFLLAGVPGLLVALVALNVGGIRERLFGAGPKPITSIAVLPLENLSGDPEQEYFADGMTEALTTELGKISALRVISRQSVMRYKGTDKPLPEIARELNVDAIVEGSVLKDGQHVRISAQLIQAVPERHLWAQSYQRDLEQVLSLQSHLALAIADEIKIILTPDEEARLASTRSVNPLAYEAYLKGGSLSNTPCKEGLEKTIEGLQKAIELDPDYPPPYARLAYAHMCLAAYNLGPDAEHYPKAREAALKALEIDDTLAEAHAVLGFVKFHFEWDWPAGERELRRAIELNSNSAVAHNGYANYLHFMGRTEEALAQMKRAQELDPFSLSIRQTLGWLLYDAHRYEQAIAAFQSALELVPDFPPAHMGIGLAYVQKGMHEEAIAELQEAVARGGVAGPSMYPAALAYAYAVSGRKTEARKILNELKQQRKRGHISPSNIARIYAGLGEKDRAFEWLEKAYEERDEELLYYRGPMLDPLRSDPRFQSLLRRLNFPE